VSGLDAGLAAALLLFASVYLGTGWSLVLFSFPIAPRLTVDTYDLPMVQPVRNATRFFTVWTVLMLVAAVWLLARLDEGRWMPAVYLAATVAATLVTVVLIFPYNKEMRAGVRDEPRLRFVLGRWMRFNVLRVLLWTVQWAAVTLWFVLEVT
jgi:hypothetical protein